MEVTQDAILDLLIEEGGKMKNSDFLSKFKDTLNCADQAEKKRNRDLFRRFVNNVAVVKEFRDVKYVVLMRRYKPLIKGQHDDDDDNNMNKCDKEEVPGEYSPVRDKVHTTPHSQDGGSGTSAPDRVAQEKSSSVSERASNDSLAHSPTEAHYLIESALRRTTSGPDLKHKRPLNYTDQTSEVKKEGCVGAPKTEATAVMPNKPYALPLRTPPNVTMIHKLKTDDDPPARVHLEHDSNSPSGNKRRPSIESVGLGSPQLRRAVKNTKPSEEPKFPSTVPLEQAEHEWLVRSASGHWSQVYGLLLRDAQLAERRDFMSGFTALHWAAKCGNSEMVAKIIEITRKRGVEIDINAKTHGGYTPLHIAALHDQEFILAKLVDEYGADVHLRDNCGKKPYHYLHKGISERVRELLGEPKMQPQPEPAGHEREELDLFPDLSKGLHTISRLFQPHVLGGHKKKHKQRAALYSLGDDPREETE